jgi:hypothetical protein
MIRAHTKRLPALLDGPITADREIGLGVRVLYESIIYLATNARAPGETRAALRSWRVDRRFERTPS